MLSSSEILRILSRLKEHLAQYGVSHVGLFGSSLHGRAGENSDIDILIDFQSDKETYTNFMASCELLENEFADQKIDIVTLKGLSPFIGKHILQEVVYV